MKIYELTIHADDVEWDGVVGATVLAHDENEAIQIAESEHPDLRWFLLDVYEIDEPKLIGVYTIDG
ncbi:hypothetical protein HUG15_05655 [Salicibibacter cibarius]|uniref:Uncharacterized protein n=1 Tax=Salicibibacter cibarius TaxID=2743000 RepID=A0A7T7CAW2_9BACI|nr:hypothetical protein [Salicibibacter cibarius]QQK75078.1 hypothetical protein HUG15_05320 [Salicibibacter cibarius]QQK75139.1 hypothetical protein HUG15_05655 [Salicibibacter cibarius]